MSGQISEDIFAPNEGYCLYSVLYLPVYKSIPFLKPKNKFLFLCKNFLEKFIIYLRISFQVRYGYMKKVTATLDIKFITSLT